MRDQNDQLYKVTDNLTRTWLNGHVHHLNSGTSSTLPPALSQEPKMTPTKAVLLSIWDRVRRWTQTWREPRPPGPRGTERSCALSPFRVCSRKDRPSMGSAIPKARWWNRGPGRRQGEPKVKSPAKFIRIQSFKLQIHGGCLQEMLKSLANSGREFCFL